MAGNNPPYVKGIIIVVNSAILDFNVAVIAQ